MQVIYVIPTNVRHEIYAHSRTVGDACPYGVGCFLCADGSSHAQAPSVPIRRAGRSARDEAWGLPYALGGEKSVIGGTSSPSVAPHLHRKFVREVRSEFWGTVARASGRSTCKVVCFFCNFSFKQRKVNNPRGKGNACADEGACGFCSNYSSTANAVPLPSQGKARGRCTPAVWATRSELCRMRE